MYAIWSQPSFLTFLWFYLAVGGIVLKWVFFTIIDRIYMKLRLRRVRQELEGSRTRVEESNLTGYRAHSQQIAAKGIPDVGVDVELKKLEDEVLFLAGMVAEAMRGALESLARKDMKRAREVIEKDPLIDSRELAIRNCCLQIISDGNPDTSNLRMLVAVLGMITELERMGDYAEGIARITLMIGNQSNLEVPAELSIMAQKGMEMLTSGMESFVRRDVMRGTDIFRSDDEVDKIYDRLFQKLLLLMIRDPGRIVQGTWLVWAAHNLERFADRVSNICEWSVYSVTGERINIAALKQERSEEEKSGEDRDK
jgi:phosphate transport system protein